MTQNTLSNRARFFESLLVILLVLSAGTILIFQAIRTFAPAQDEPVRISPINRIVGPGSTISQGIKLFHYDTGVWPLNLQELFVSPSDPAIANKWTGQYVERAQDLLDPWGRPFQYRAGKQTKHNIGSFDLWSLGPDGIDGTPDDINNWSP